MATKNAKSKTTKATRAPSNKVNGVTRPAGEITGKVWDVADKLSTKSNPAERGAVMEACEKLKINRGTIATQYQRWRVYNGLGRIPRAKKVPKPPVTKAAAKKAGKKMASKPKLVSAKPSVPKPPAQASA